MYTIMNRFFISKTENITTERMIICADTVSDFPSVDGIDGCKIAQGSIAWDVSTGDFYGMLSTGDWVNQSSSANTAQTLELTAEDYSAADTPESEVAEDDEPMGYFEGAEAGVQ